MSLWGILLLKKCTSVIILPQENSISVDATFAEKDNYSLSLIFRGKNHLGRIRTGTHSYSISLCVLDIILRLFVSQVL